MSTNNSDDHEWATIEQAIKKLPREKQPVNSAWSNIQSRISAEPVSNRNGASWMPYAVAASLFIAVLSTAVSLKTMNDYEQFKSQQLAYQMDIKQLQIMEQKARLVKANFQTDLARVSTTMDPATVADINNNLAIIEQALLDIKQSMVEQPENTRLASLLERTYQQEVSMIQGIKSAYPEFRGDI